MKIQELSACLVLSHEGRLLLLKRNDDLWEFPAGAVGWGENPQDSAARATREKTGLTPRNISFFMITSATNQKEQDELHCVHVVYKGEAGGTDVVISPAHTEFRWVMPHEAKYMKLSLNAEPILDLL